MGIEFRKVGGVVRSVYPQFGGDFILADECKCRVDYSKPSSAGVSFTVIRSNQCPVDEHKQEFLNSLQPPVNKSVQGVQNS